MTGFRNSRLDASVPALVLLLFSGAAGLAHQVIWTRRLVDVLGASAETFSRVVGAFCIGLALGSALAAARPARTASAWRRVALAELTVALLGLIVLQAPPMADAVRDHWGIGAGLRWGLPAFLIIPPAVAMGLVLPAVLSAVRNPAITLQAYAINTFGGVLGIALTVFIALPALGLRGAGVAVCGLSGLLALGAWTAHRVSGWSDLPNPSPDPSTGHSARPDFIAPRVASLLAFASGFLVLGLEVTAQHQFAQIAINSHFSGATILAIVLLSLTGSTFALVLLEGRGRRWDLGNLLLMAGGVWTLQPLLFLWLRPGLQILPYELAPAAYFLRLTGLAVLTLAPGFVVSGLLFPRLLQSAGEPRTIARLLAWNGLGSWMGAETFQIVLLPSLGLWRTALAAAGTYLLFALPLVRSAGREASPCRPAWRGWRAALALILVWTAVWPRAARWPQVGYAPAERVVAVTTGREGVVATVVRDADDWRIVFNNSYTLGGSRAQSNQERQAHLPLLLHGSPATVALLGIATGSTLAGAAQNPGIQRLDAFELSPIAVRFAREHFAPFNRSVFDDARVRVFLDDARSGVASTHGVYDVIVGDLFLPWRTGEGRLFSREHFGAVHRALKPDGLFCQWLPLFQLTRLHYDVIVRTFLSKFPNGFLVRGDFYPELPIVGLCGFAGGRSLDAVDWTGVARACERLRAAGTVADPLARHVDGVAMCVVGPLPSPGPGPVNTLDNAWLEWDAGRNVVGLRTPWFVGVPLAEYLREVVRGSAARLPQQLRAAHDSGQFFLTLEVAARVRAPVLANLQSQILERLPASLRFDPEADWTQWPGSQKPSPGNW